jgi:transposase-like protein
VLSFANIRRWSAIYNLTLLSGSPPQVRQDSVVKEALFHRKTDLAPIYTAAILAIKKEGILGRGCRHRPVQYLNNILEQDHRAIKRRVNAKQGFREFHAARRTLQGYEAMNMIRKGQVRCVSGNDVRSQIRFIGKLFGLVA